MQKMFIFNFETLKNETEEDIRGGKVSHDHGLGGLIMLKWPLYKKKSTISIQFSPKLQYISSQNSKGQFSAS